MEYAGEGARADLDALTLSGTLDYPDGGRPGLGGDTMAPNFQQREVQMRSRTAVFLGVLALAVVSLALDTADAQESVDDAPADSEVAVEESAAASEDPATGEA